jgi:hypothetical protein
VRTPTRIAVSPPLCCHRALSQLDPRHVSAQAHTRADQHVVSYRRSQLIVDMTCVERLRVGCRRDKVTKPHIPPPSAEFTSLFSLTEYATTYETARDTYLQVCEKLE